MEDVNHLAEMAGKAAHDPFHNNNNNHGGGFEWVPYPLIIGAGPSGLAAAACLQQKGIPSVILERDSCLASLWQLRAYDRLKLHLPKQFCELPFMPFPPSFPTYPSRLDFIDYLHSYASRFGLRPVFNTRVVSAEFDQSANFWRVTTESSKVYASRWLVVATGENADVAVPNIEGMMPGEGVHMSEYKSRVCYSGKRFCVVGCGNSGIEVCLDLCNNNARPELVVLHVIYVIF